ncbi:MAG: family 10 glycosylhydrolase, partial [Prevotella sp.]|nr:family 10 glycosylhydrolase [Prevotella sp.]
MKRLFTYLLLLTALLSGSAVGASGQNKREFRGAWIQAVNGQFKGLSKEEMQAALASQLDELQRDGVNAVIFQVRVECDALYKSNIEPWSRFLTGTPGRNPGWDPLEWMVGECHKRGMELHAWINPFRAKVKDAATLPNTHICLRQPGSWFEYDGLYILNPGIPANRDYICKVAEDIVRRYDIDGFHIDDYFYPYPVAGKEIDDAKQFAMYNSQGFRNIGDWRRDNVNVFIRQLSETIHRAKPWVKFGVSPFGIYRNKKSDPHTGSNTNGLQNYDDLYADVLLWANNGWIDYCVPQLYWEIGNKSADYGELISWWNKHSG